MKSIHIATLGLLASAAQASPTEPASNPYLAVVARNVFGLLPIARTEPVTVTRKVEKPQIILNGIITILGDRRALVSYRSQAKPGEPAALRSLILAEGEDNGEIEISRIDVKNGTVEGRAFGEPMSLNFSTNSARIGTDLTPAPQPR